MTNLQMIQKLQEIVKDKPHEYQAVEDLFEILRIYERENPKQAHLWNKDVRRLSALGVKLAESDLLAEKFYYLNKKSLLFDAREDFDAYLQYLEFDREPERRFWLPRRKQLLPLVQALQDLEDDKLDLLSISLPPGTGKSTMGIFFLTWIMGKYPLSCNLASAHSDKLTRSFYDGVLSIITDPEYLWADVFPYGNVVKTNSKDETIDLVKPSRFSTLTCRSIDGSLTGATRCEKYLYADDLVSGIEEALSKDRLDSLWEKYTNDLKSRKKQGAKEIHIATRWSVHDVIGRLERMYGDDPRAKFISVPALDENGESNFDYSYGVGFDTKYFLDMKNNLDDVSWRALYMNEPIEREGLLFHPSELRRYFELPKGEPDTIIAVCDPKEKGKDYAFMPIAYVYGQDYYIEDCVCNRNLTESLDVHMGEKLLTHKVKACRYESNSAGWRTAEKIHDYVKSKNGITHITTKRSLANKEVRIITNAHWVKEHCLFKDESQYRQGSEYWIMLNFLCSWTMAGKNSYDDVPDGMAMLADFAQSMTDARVEVFKRPF